MTFSVIIPNYNREKSVITAIKSVLDQSYRNFELIVVDDCSTDDSTQVISNISDERLRLIRLSKNSGAAAARNRGIQDAQGEYISFLDSDDYYEFNFLERSLEEISKSSPEVGFMWTGIRYHYQNKIVEQHWKPQRNSTPYITFLNNLQIGSGSGITLKREIFNNISPFDEKLPAAEDTEFFLRLTKKYDYCSVPDILINVIKKGEDRMSKSFVNIAKAYNLFLPHHYEVIDENPVLQKKFYYKMMWLNFHLKDRDLANFYFKKIPGNMRSAKISVIMRLYSYLPLSIATKIHKILSS